jgi:hypothetical protein
MDQGYFPHTGPPEGAEEIQSQTILYPQKVRVNYMQLPYYYTLVIMTNEATLTAFDYCGHPHNDNYHLDS